jgi:hypothetical protein
MVVGGRAQLRMNGDVPVPSTVFSPGEGDKPANALTSFNYRSIGTNIDVAGTSSLGERFGFTLTVSDSWIQADVESTKQGRPSFQSFQVTNTVYLRDGETAEFTAATDRITGEVTKVEVMVKVLK